MSSDTFDQPSPFLGVGRTGDPGWGPSSTSPTVVVPLKTPGIAVLLSIFWLGAGHLYVGRIMAGAVLAGINAVLVLFVSLFLLVFPVVGLLLWLLVALPWVPAVVVSAIDSAAAAKRYNDRLIAGPRG